MKTINEINAIKEKAKTAITLGGAQKMRAVVGIGTCGIAAGANPVLAQLMKK